MAVSPIEHSDEARAALRLIVAENGPEALSKPTVVSNLLKDFLPDSPAIARVLVAAAEDRIADQLREYAAQGLDMATAVGLTTSAFASTTMLTPETCAWVVNEFAIALGLTGIEIPVSVPDTSSPPTVGVGDPVTRPFVPIQKPDPDLTIATPPVVIPARRPRRMKWPVLVTAGLLAVVVVVVIAVATSGPSFPQHLTVQQLSAGSCVTGSDLPLGGGGSWPYKVTAVSCTQGHRAEFFFADNSFWSAASPFPGGHAVDNRGDARCRAAFTAYVGVGPDVSKYHWAVVLPDTSGSWKAGFRDLDCYAYLSTGHPHGGQLLRYSVKGANQ